MLVPKDSQGSRCGLDSHVANKPYLFFFDLTKCLHPQVPFRGCPTQQVSYTFHIITIFRIRKLLNYMIVLQVCVEKCPKNVFIFPESTYSKENMICVNNEKPVSSSLAEHLVDAGKCARWYLPSVSG